MNDLRWMDLAIKVAGMSGRDVPIGSVIVDAHGNQLAHAHNEVEMREDPTAHSEMICIQRACAVVGSRYLDGCTIYCTLEPCAMCSQAIKLARINRVIFGAFRNIEISRSCDMVGGIMERECSELLSSFFLKLR